MSDASPFIDAATNRQWFVTQPSPPDITIIGEGGQPLVTIHPTGELDYGPDYEPDEAARVFWDALRRLTPARCPVCGHIGLDTDHPRPATAQELGDAHRYARTRRDHWQQRLDELDRRIDEFTSNEEQP